MEFRIRNPKFRERIEQAHKQQAMLRTLATRLDTVAAGDVTMSMPFDNRFTQQNGYLHAGTVTTLADAACGFAALSLMAAEQDVLSVEFKLNLMAPATGDRLLAKGAVIRPGRTLTVCQATVSVQRGETLVEVARFQGTMIAVPTSTPSH